MARYEFTEGTSNKFWEAELAGKQLTVRWGRIGGTPSEKVTSFKSPDEAKAAHDKLVAEKTGKGYALAGGGKAAKAAAPAKSAKAAKAAPAPKASGKVKPTTSIRAKGHSHDVSKEPAQTVDVKKVEKNLGMPVGPVMRELIELCEATYPSSPAEAFSLLGQYNQLIFEVFIHPSTHIGSTIAKHARLRPFATDHKNEISFVLGTGKTTDDHAIAYNDRVNAEESKVVAVDLATYLSQLAFDPAVGYNDEDKADITRLVKNLKTHSAVSAKRAKAEVPDDLSVLDLDEAPDAKPAKADGGGKAGKGGVPSAAEIEKAKKLKDKAEELKWDKSAKAALPIAQQALATLQRIPYSHDSGYVREGAEEAVLELMIEAKQTAAAKRLWEELIDRWSAEGAGGVSWLAMAEAQGKLKAKIPAAIRDRVRRAWARGRFGNVFDFEGETDRKAPTKPSKDYPFVDAQVALMHEKVALARQCLAAARKSEEEPNDSHDLFEIAILEVEGKHDEAVAEWRKLLASAFGSKQWQPWECLAALAVRFGTDDAATTKRIATAWKKQDDEAASAIFES
jgi:predicted DNA-binding WGR domain protein